MQKRNSKIIGSKILAYLKKNIYYVMMIGCVIAIATIVTVVAVVNTPDNGPDLPIDNNLDQDTNKPIDKPEDTTFVLSLPIADGTVIREFNDKKLLFDVTQKDYRTHTAVDIGAKQGSAVLAMYDGVVKDVKTDKHDGTVVVIEHKNGYVTTMKLLDKVTVTKNQAVKKGDKLGVVGSFLFECKQDSHIHCELTKDGKLIDMMQFIADGNK